MENHCCSVSSFSITKDFSCFLVLISTKRIASDFMVLIRYYIFSKKIIQVIHQIVLALQSNSTVASAIEKNKNISHHTEMWCGCFRFLVLSCTCKLRRKEYRHFCNLYSNVWNNCLIQSCFWFSYCAKFSRILYLNTTEF